MNPSKTILLTGATSGIGYAASLSLIQECEAFIFIARNPSKAKELSEKLSTINPKAKVHFYLADLSLMAATADVAKQILDTHTHIDTLILNAGILGPEQQTETDEGFEITFATNHLSLFLLARLLQPLLSHAEDARLIVTASEAHRLARFDRDKLLAKSKYGALQAYALSKMCNILFTQAFAKHYSDSGIKANVFHPGAVNTNFGQGEGGLLRKIAFLLAKPFFITAEQGAQTLLHLAQTDAGRKHQAKYWNKKKIILPSKDAQNEKHADALWTMSEALVKGYL